jgi:uncharacterized protein (TIGR02145 family)
MKKLFLIAIAVLTGIYGFAQSETDGTSPVKTKRQKKTKEWKIKDDGVEINGVVWATRNVDTPGKFVGSPQFKGNGFYPKEINTACPEGWRLPTTAEFQSLVEAGYEWAHIYDVQGLELGYGDHTIFLPATVKYIKKYGFTPDMSNFLNGYYWTSTPEKGAIGQRFHFSPHAVDPFYRAGGYPHYNVRCVKAADITK